MKLRIVNILWWINHRGINAFPKLLISNCLKNEILARGYSECKDRLVPYVVARSRSTTLLDKGDSCSIAEDSFSFV
jgi:hypothetical protein